MLKTQIQRPEMNPLRVEVNLGMQKHKMGYWMARENEENIIEISAERLE